jgi:competence protein ComEA
MSVKNLIKNLIILSLVSCLALTFLGCGNKDEGFYMEISENMSDAMSNDMSMDMLSSEASGDGEAGGFGDKTAHIFVYVCGAVEAPGVYELEKGSRLYEAVELAGGMKDGADEAYLNMAREITDGEQIVVYTKAEVESLNEQAVIAAATAGLVNINTAGQNELTTISGIGESRAKAIIDYREKNGSFNSIEDIMKVDGIKEGLFSKIKDKITV